MVFIKHGGLTVLKNGVKGTQINLAKSFYAIKDLILVKKKQKLLMRKKSNN